MKTQIIAGLLCMLSTAGSLLFAQEKTEVAPIPLWAQAVPGALGTSDKDIPQLTPYLPLPEKATGAAIVIFPGGGYGHLAIDHEGHRIAKWFSGQGIAAFIVKYRLGSDGYGHPIPLLDAQRAIRKVRSEAGTWKISPDKIGIIGFSAGGHLASSAGTHFQNPVVLNDQKTDSIDSVSCRPDFMVLMYPVISMQDGITHGGSKANLLGKNPSSDLVELMSNEKQISDQTPPTFLVHAEDDNAVLPENSILFYEGLRKANVPCELHIYLKGGHGFGMRQESGPAAGWPILCIDWLRQLNFLPKTAAATGQ
jgi:acetyl esterase/lipase